MSQRFTYIDLFSGCGGLSLGLHNAGWKGLFAVEKNADAFKTLKYNLIDKKNHFDWPIWLHQKNWDIDALIRTHAEKLKDLNGQVDLVAGGPPCQGFSTAGRRVETDLRNSLIKSYIRFIKLVKPKIIFFENVKGFTLEFKRNKERGRKYSEYVLSKLSKLGYKVEGQLIDFSEYGIPQKRVRFILVGVLIEEANLNNLVSSTNGFFTKIKENRTTFLVNKGLQISVTLSEAISDLLKEHGQVISPDDNNFQAGVYSRVKSSYQKYMRSECEHEIPDSHRFANHKQEVIDKLRDILATQVQRNKNLSQELREKYNIKKHTIIPLDSKLPTPTITTLPDDLIHYKEPRILTVREYARIQSFPDWYEFKGKYTTGGKQRVVEVPRYSQIGNAIPPLFGEQSGLTLKQLLINAT